MDFKIEEEVAKVEIYGQLYSLAYAKAKEVMEYNKAVKGQEPEMQFKTGCDFLEAGGLPKDLIENLSMKNIIALVELRMGVKKN